MYRIGQVAKQLGVDPYVIRYWMTEFPQIENKRDLRGRRIFSERDVTVLREIKRLLREVRLTIKGARQRLEDMEQQSVQQSQGGLFT